VVVESHRTLDLQPGVQLDLWGIQVNGLKELTATLLVLRDGTEQVASKVEHKWETWDDSQPPAAGQILFLMQDGQPFGVTDKQVPLLAVDFPKLPNGLRSQTSANITIENSLKPGASTSTNEGTLMSFPPGTPHSAILYAKVFVPENFVGEISLAPQLDILQKAAESGRTVLAIRLDWIAQ
jgi:hypothetical protein